MTNSISKKQVEDSLCKYFAKHLDLRAEFNRTAGKDLGISISAAANVTTTRRVKCQHILLRGKRKGKKCGKDCKDGETMCSLHLKFTPKISGSTASVGTCSHKLLRGPRKGQQCGKRCVGSTGFCSCHAPTSHGGAQSGQSSHEVASDSNFQDVRCLHVHRSGRQCCHTCTSDRSYCDKHKYLYDSETESSDSYDSGDEFDVSDSESENHAESDETVVA